MPTVVSIAPHAGRLGADQHRSARGRGLGREVRVKPCAIENPAQATVGEHDLGIIGRLKNDIRDASRDPGGAIRIHKLAQPRVPDALGAAHRCTDRPVPFQQDHVQLRRGQLRLPRRDGPRRSRAHDQDVDVRHRRPSRAPRRGRGRYISRIRCRLRRPR